MRAALITELQGLPSAAEVDAPAGPDVVEVLAAPLNPIDLAVSRGMLATGHPELPYVPGCEGVGRTADGRLVWVFGGGARADANGAMAERAAIGDALAIDVPDGADPAVAAALGIAGLAGWLPFAWRAPARGRRERARARRDAGRSASSPCRRRSSSAPGASSRRAEARQGLERAVALGADATIRLDETRRPRRPRSRTPSAGTARATSSTRSGGAPAAAAVQAAVPWATIVNLGQSAGATSELASAAVRFKSLSILGHTNFAVPPTSSPSTTAGSSAT